MVRADATAPPLATDAFPDDDASVATAARASTDVSVAGTVAESRLSPWDPSLIPKAVDEATQVALEEKARNPVRNLFQKIKADGLRERHAVSRMRLLYSNRVIKRRRV